MHPLSTLLLLLPLLPAPEDRFVAAPRLAARIDALVAQHWAEQKLQPAAVGDDASFLRRVTLDLNGRIPTVDEAKTFLSDPSPDKRSSAIRRLLESPEYSLYMGRVLDEIIQGKNAGDADFVEFLRDCLARHRRWDETFRHIILGPWDSPEDKRADKFLSRRVTNLDDLTTDTARVFFGVNVSCAKCHDHPLVADWKQDHYYGMASFFNRTQPKKGTNRRNAEFAEQPTGDVTFVTTKGERKTAKVMFLTSQVIEDKPAPFSRREQLVRVALEQKAFFSRAIVNRLWAYFMGRGLVHPVDQMHSANPASVPGVLEFLGDDLAANGYDLDRIVAALVNSRVYQLSTTYSGEEPADRHFARAALRPLTPQQYAMSLALASGNGSLDASARAKSYRELENRIAPILKAQTLDGRGDRYEASAGEALYMSNHGEIQKLVAPQGNNLAAKLAALTDAGQVVEMAVWSILSRPPESEERAKLTQFLADHQDRNKTCSELVWALLTAAEFRFNH